MLIKGGFLLLDRQLVLLTFRRATFKAYKTAIVKEIRRLSSD